MVAVAKKRKKSFFGQKLRELRLAKDWTQGEVAERMGMLYQSVAKYERGATLPSLEIAERFADLFGVSLDVFREKPADAT